MNTTPQTPYLSQVEDYTVSHQKFDLQYDSRFDLLHTFPQPPASELGKYYESDDYISHTDSKRSWFEKAYHMVKKRALNQKVQLLEKYQPNKGNLLDMGCGTGDFLQVAQQAGWQVQGIEPNEKAQKIAASKGATLISGTPAAADQTFDAITLWHVLEHLPNLELQIKELKRILKPTGTLLIAVPNYKSFDAGYYKQFWAAYDVPRHLWHFSKTSIDRLVEQEGMKVVSVRPMKFDSFYVSLLSEKYKTGKMNYVNAFFVGLYSNWKGSQTKEYSSHIYVIKNS
ncbi:MAG: Ubiquinone biosynthesis O-methyltransferase [Bacteroidota bacterium]|jgi:ubiquinone/menaquinone biosynthesis C-methylase UbiE